MMLIYAALGAGAYGLFKELPGSFLPQEDQGYIIAIVQLPSADIVTVLGFNFSGRGQNMGIAFIPLKPWDERRAPGQTADAIAGNMLQQFFGIRDAFIYALSPPPIPELGESSGFDMRLEDRNNQGHEALLNARNQLLGMAAQDKRLNARNQLLGMAAQDKRLGGVRPSGLEDAPQLQLTINRDAAYAKGVSVANIAKVLGAYRQGAGGGIGLLLYQ